MKHTRLYLVLGTLAYVLMWYGQAQAFFADDLRRMIDIFDWMR